MNCKNVTNSQNGKRRAVDGLMLGLTVAGEAGKETLVPARRHPLSVPITPTFFFLLARDGAVIEGRLAPPRRKIVTLDDMCGKKLWDCYWWNCDSEAQRQLRDSCKRAAGGETPRNILTIRMPKGQSMTSDVVLVPLTDAEGTIAHLIALGTNVTNATALSTMKGESARIKSAPARKTATPDVELAEAALRSARPIVELTSTKMAGTASSTHAVAVQVAGSREQLGRARATAAAALAKVDQPSGLGETGEPLQGLSARLIKAQEEERSHLARELHDDLSQRVATMAIELEQLGQEAPRSQPGLRASLGNLWAQAQQLSSELHRLSHGLHPSTLDQLDLAASVRALCQEFSHRHQLQIDFSQQGFPGDLPKDIKLCIFRIAQESLRNVVKHSGSCKAMVHLEKTDRAINLNVSDDGCGFDIGAASIKQGLGFISMTERVRLVAGDITIHSERSRGTRISVSAPLNPCRGVQFC